MSQQKEDSSETRRSLGEPLHIARQRLLDDPHTGEIAASLEMEIDAYADLVLEYAQQPEKEPDLEVYEEDAEGLEDTAETRAAVENWFQAVESGEVELGPKRLHDQDQIGANRSAAARRLIGAEPARPNRALRVKPASTGAGAVLRKQLQHRRAANEKV